LWRGPRERVRVAVSIDPPSGSNEGGGAADRRHEPSGHDVRGQVTLRLRDTTSGDLDFVLRAESDPDAAPFIVRWDRARHERAIRDPDEAHLLILDRRRALGFVLLAGLDTDPDSVELRRIVVVHRGQGVGRRALTMVLDYAFDRLGAQQVWLDVMVNNIRARRAYASAGFVLEGVVRDGLITPDGRRSIAIMSVLRTQWRAAS
jgi:diamine N-acetyltransferase